MDPTKLLGIGPDELECHHGPPFCVEGRGRLWERPAPRGSAPCMVEVRVWVVLSGPSLGGLLIARRIVAWPGII